MLLAYDLPVSSRSPNEQKMVIFCTSALNVVKPFSLRLNLCRRKCLNKFLLRITTFERSLMGMCHLQHLCSYSGSKISLWFLFFFAFSCIDIETSTSLLLYFERVKLLCIKFWGILLHVCSISECNVVMMRIWRSVSLAKLINMALPWHQHLANISFDNGYERLREHIQNNKTLCRTKN